MAFITPIAISLAVRLGELAPANQEYLGYITGAGALWVMLTAPFMGIWSDRTRTRIGRRRPFMIGGMIVGVLSLIVMALAPSVLLLGAGWILAQWGWGTVLGNLQNSTADRLPESSAWQGRRPDRVRNTGRPGHRRDRDHRPDRQRAAALPRPRCRGRGARHLVRDPRPRGRQPRASAGAHRRRRSAAKVRLQPAQVPRLLLELAGTIPLLLRPHTEHHLHGLLLRRPSRRLHHRGLRRHRHPRRGRRTRHHRRRDRRRIHVRPASAAAKLFLVLGGAIMAVGMVTMALSIGPARSSSPAH